MTIDGIKTKRKSTGLVHNDIQRGHRVWTSYSIIEIFNRFWVVIKSWDLVDNIIMSNLQTLFPNLNMAFRLFSIIFATVTNVIRTFSVSKKKTVFYVKSCIKTNWEVLKISTRMMLSTTLFWKRLKKKQYGIKMYCNQLIVK